MLARIRLQEKGHRVIEARNGREAVEAFHHELIDIILMDVHMPEMDGLEATRAIREIEAENGGHIPIMALTASVMKEDQDICLKAGMDIIAGKPIDFDELFSLMDQIVPEGKGFMHEDLQADSQDQDGIDKPLDCFTPLEAIDTETGLARIGGSHSAYRNLLMKFRKNYADVPKKIKKAVTGNEKSEAGRLVHSIKGLAGNIGADALHAAAVDLETAFNQNHPENIGRCLNHFIRAFNQVMDSLNTLTDEKNGGPMDNKQSTGFIDLEIVKPLLEKLKSMLEDDDMDALECLETLKNHLPAAAFEADLEKIQSFLDEYELQNALIILKNVSDKLTGALKG